MGERDTSAWVDRQVQTIVDALKKLNPDGSGTFQLAPDWSGPDREHAFALVGEQLRALGYNVTQSGPSLIVNGR